MRFDFYHLSFETPGVRVHLWSPWRATQLEHRLFDALKSLQRVEQEDGPDERRLLLTDPRSCRAALQAIARVLKGWQEDAAPGSERRVWRWLLEADTDEGGYDHNGEPASLWCYLRLSLEQGGLGDTEKGEDIDLDGFGLEVLGGS